MLFCSVDIIIVTFIYMKHALCNHHLIISFLLCGRTEKKSSVHSLKQYSEPLCLFNTCWQIICTLDPATYYGVESKFCDMIRVHEPLRILYKCLCKASGFLNSTTWQVRKMPLLYTKHLWNWILMKHRLLIVVNHWLALHQSLLWTHDPKLCGATMHVQLKIALAVAVLGLGQEMWCRSTSASSLCNW